MDIGKAAGLAILLVGLVFVAESLVVMYALGLIPAAGMNQSLSQFAALALVYSIVKLIAGAIAAVSGIFLMKK